MTIRRDLHQANRRSWDAATLAHNQHKQAQAQWLRAGHELLFDEDYELLGPLAGKTLLHLQCNSGQDTLCLARRGASVTGVDISDEAITFARALAAETGIPGSFERADIYDWLPSAAAAGRRFDLVYSSYGWLGWLSDLRAWARGVASVLRPGGRLVLVEFHPFAFMFDRRRQLVDSYFGAAEGEVIDNPGGVGDYVAEAPEALAPSGYAEASAFENPHPAHEFAWTIADLLAAVREAGLELERFEEWDHANGCRFYDDLVPLAGDEDGRRWTTAPGQPRVPLMLGLRARKPEGVAMVQVDAFTDTLFSGNPAAICVLEEELPAQTMQAIATENNLSETAFIRRLGDHYAIRWFTPTTEIDLCGHATLASAFVVLDQLEPERDAVVFESRLHGLLTVRREPGGDRLMMDFPADPPKRIPRFDPDLARALGAAPVELWLAGYWMVVLESEAQVRALRPDLKVLTHMRPAELIVTAPADDPQIDFVSRFFGPGVGIDEDPVTGSAHCVLAPYWAEQLGKPRLCARQVSARGGELECVVAGDRVELIGRCVRYSSGRVMLPRNQQVGGSTGPE
ncbi:MAG: PhzF family phenazine biosynthesis isomerase [Enhygromyxa sp.]